MSRRQGPVEDRVWPEKLVGHVVTTEGERRIHGYAVESDLARYYDFGEVLLLTLSGAPPDEVTGKAFHIALTFLSPVTITEAPAHAAAIASLCGTMTSAVNGIGAITLAEQARDLITRHGDLLRWLERPRGTLPASARSSSPEDKASVKALRARLDEISFPCPALAKDPSREAALLILLDRCGLKTAWAKESALVIARLAVTAAEAHAVATGSFSEYPMSLPDFVYQGEER